MGVSKLDITNLIVMWECKLKVFLTELVDGGCEHVFCEEIEKCFSLDNDAYDSTLIFDEEPNIEIYEEFETHDVGKIGSWIVQMR